MRKAPNFYSVDEVAEKLGLSAKTVRRRVSSGELVAHRFGGALRISDEDLRAYIAVRRA